MEGTSGGGGGYGCGAATAAAEGGISGGGGARRVLVRERKELLAEGVRVRTSEFTLEATGEGIAALRGETAHGASRLGNWTLRQLGRMH